MPSAKCSQERRISMRSRRSSDRVREQSTQAISPRGDDCSAIEVPTDFSSVLLD